MKTYLPDDFHGSVVRAIEEKGVYPHIMLVLDQNDQLHVHALALAEPEQVMHHMMKVLVNDKPKQLIYGMDRYCKPGQGTTLGDCVAGAYWSEEADSWRVFVIEYQHEPRIVKPLDWNNEFWKRAIRDELTSFLTNALGQRGTK